MFKVPPRYTYVCQPADVAWNQPFKTWLRQRWLDYLRTQITEHHVEVRQRADEARKVSEQVNEVARTEYQEVVREKIQAFQQSLVISPFEMVAPKGPEITAWVAEAWSELTYTTIVSGFGKAG
ncbi:hypothetical protein ON010_g11053 [Phytophthora cinnamomi]|nr:hypothetical protein ON010_g11053 [Phytophthora cinnamomi]